MSLDAATVRRIAKLARIRVGDDEVERLAGELGTIIGWVEQLRAIDVEGVEPLTGPVQAALRMREDVVTAGDLSAEVLANAPERVGSFFAVPKMVE